MTREKPLQKTVGREDAPREEYAIRFEVAQTGATHRLSTSSGGALSATGEKGARRLRRVRPEGKLVAEGWFLSLIREKGECSKGGEAVRKGRIGQGDTCSRGFAHGDSIVKSGKNVIPLGSTQRPEWTQSQGG